MRTTVSLATCLAFVVASPISLAEEPPKASVGRPTARQLIERIKQHVGCPWSDQTVDTFKAGNPDMPVTGVAVTMLATWDVLHQAAASGKNLVITHEPTFYNHTDDTTRLADDKVLADKQAFLRAHGIIVWRFHDHWHRRRPDGILQGMAEKLGWQAYLRPEQEGLFQLPETTVRRLAGELKEKLHASAVRVVGKADMKATGVGMLPGAPGSAAQIHMLQRSDVSVLITGESPEWETVEYVRDAATSGKPKALILLGHASSEQAGMEYCAAWLRTFISEVPIEFVPAADPFWTPSTDVK